MSDTSQGRPGHAAIAEASAWLARLRAEDCGPEDRRAFAAWLDADADHHAAFERATSLFDLVGAVQDRWPREMPEEEAESVARPGRRIFLAGAGATVVGAGALGWQAAFAGTIETGFGERRNLALDDGTRVLMDAETRLREPWLRPRRIDLERGRISLKAPAGGKAFEVRAGDHRLRARAMDGDVRLGRDGLTVTLVEGEMFVDRAGGMPIRLGAGQRLLPSGLVDQPDLAALTAWRQGRLVFADTPLAEVCAELNRYDRLRLVPDPDVTGLRVSGTFALGSNARFANGIGQLLDIRAVRNGDTIALRHMREQ